MMILFKRVREYERVLIFRGGLLRSGRPRGPGVIVIIPFIDKYQLLDMRTATFDIAPQEILTSDSVTVVVDAVVYYRVCDPTKAVINVQDYSQSTRLLVSTFLRTALGTKSLTQILSERKNISEKMQLSLNEATEQWGVKVERVEIKNVHLPKLLRRAMTQEAEASREVNLKIIAAEGEIRAAKALKEAAENLSKNPAALQLRYLQALRSFASGEDTTIIFDFPFDILKGIFK